MNCHGLRALPQPKGRKKTGNAEHVVEMSVGQQEPIKPSKARPAPQQLALSPLAAINQDAMTSRLDEKSRVVTFG
jgi:hypothetical protein